MAARRWIIGLACGLLGAFALPAQASDWSCEGPNVLVYQDTKNSDSIKEGDFAKLKARLAECVKPGRGGGRAGLLVVMSSRGGSVSESLAMSDHLIGLRNQFLVTTRVPRGFHCVSACTYLFLAGETREVDAAASFEPHGFSSFQGEAALSALNGVQLPPGDQLTEAQINEISAKALGVRSNFMAALFGAEEAVARTPTALKGDANWGWLHELFGRPTAQAHARLVQAGALPPGAPAEKTYAYFYWVRQFVDALRGLTPEQWKQLNTIETTIATLMPDLEREAVAREHAQRFDTPETAAQRQEFLNRHAARLVKSLEILTQKPMPNALRTELIGRLRDQQLPEVVRSRVTLFRDRLMPYLKGRSKEVVVDGLVKLMFSTSILYTRGLTREELCDLNIVNTTRACEFVE